MADPLDSETTARAEKAGEERFELVHLRLPVKTTFAALVGALALGVMLPEGGAREGLVALFEPLGALWLRALQMTIIPLVAALLVLGVVQLARAARGGRVAALMLAMVFALLLISALAAALATPLLLEAFPVPEGARALLIDAEAPSAPVPTIGDFLTSLVAPNIVAAAAETAMLPLTLFFALLALAIARLPEGQASALLTLFHALANAMLVMIGWVLYVAPLGVFALALGVAAKSGADAFAAFGHYILAVSAIGGIVLALAYVIGAFAARGGVRAFARALLPAQAVAISTQSSLASLPAMLESADRLGLRASTAEFVLPLAVAIFRATSPAMNLAVAIYIAHLVGVELTAAALLGAVGVALVISIGSVSLPGSISFVVSIAPIAIALGVPVAPLALLVAVEMMPDLMRTIGNVTMNVALAASVDRLRDQGTRHAASS